MTPGPKVARRGARASRIAGDLSYGIALTPEATALRRRVGSTWAG